MKRLSFEVFSLKHSKNVKTLNKHKLAAIGLDDCPTCKARRSEPCRTIKPSFRRAGNETSPHKGRKKVWKRTRLEIQKAKG